MIKNIGYASGVFDLFHIGHLNLIKRAKERCDILIIGITTDEVAFQMKGKYPVISFEERSEIVKSIKYVDLVLPKIQEDNMSIIEENGVTKMFKGSDWKGSPKGEILEIQLIKAGVELIYLPYTESTSSTLLKETLLKIE
jgi:glycerol-3-phosphate cytidylyltransferase